MNNKNFANTSFHTSSVWKCQYGIMTRPRSIIIVSSGFIFYKNFKIYAFFGCYPPSKTPSPARSFMNNRILTYVQKKTVGLKYQSQTLYVLSKMREKKKLWWQGRGHEQKAWISNGSPTIVDIPKFHRGKKTDNPWFSLGSFISFFIDGLNYANGFLQSFHTLWELKQAKYIESKCF